MISIKECLDYSDLTEDEVSIVALREGLPFAIAAELACCLAQSANGIETLRYMLQEAIHDASRCHQADTLKIARRAYKQFSASFPEP
jgi:hypothetical protein